MPVPTLPPWITPRHHAVLAAVIARCEALGVPYVATGGLAGNLHGSDWPLHDIDLDVPGAALPLLAATWPDAVRAGPGPYADEEFVLDFLVLELDGITVELSAAESVRLRTPAGETRAWPTDLGDHVLRAVGGLTVRTMPLAAVVAYKTVIGRTADVAALSRLRPDGAGSDGGACL